MRMRKLTGGRALSAVKNFAGLVSLKPVAGAKRERISQHGLEQLPTRGASV